MSHSKLPYDVTNLQAGSNRDSKLPYDVTNLQAVTSILLMLPSMVEIPGGRIIYPKWYRRKRGTRPDTVITDSLHS